MYLLSINTKEGGTQDKMYIPSRVLLFLVIVFSFVLFTISNYF